MLLHFHFRRTLFLSAAAVNFLVVFFHCLESASTNHALTSCYFACFNFSFSLSDCALCMGHSWTEKNHFLKCARKFFSEFTSVKIHLLMIYLVI